jgi:multiple sugar transport system substrate-binding protein
MTCYPCLAAALCLFAVPSLHDTAAAAAVTFWTTEVERDRQQTQQRIALEFARQTGINVRVVPVEENLLAERVTAAYAAKSLPDVIFHPMEFTVGWCEAGILDAHSATEVIRALGEETFAAGPLNLARFGKEFAAVPADGWGQLLLYRKDLFAEKRLPTPDSWDLILSAAAALHNPPLLWGFEAATDPGQVYTQQVFEHLALSNGVRLASADGKVDLTTPEMIDTLEFYRKLAKFTPPGNLYWLHTRMDYLSGRAAMILWSPFILDELSGLRRDQPVIPDIAKSEPGFLARNTGLVSAPSVVLKAAANTVRPTTSESRAMPTEKPLRPGCNFCDGGLPQMAWDGGRRQAAGQTRHPGETQAIRRRVDPAGVRGDHPGPDRPVLRQRDRRGSFIAGAETFDRWGFSEGKGALVSKIYGTKIIPQVLKRFLEGELSAAQAAEMMTTRVKALE